jgi:hypothetical protein
MEWGWLTPISLGVLKIIIIQAWWHLPVISVLRRWRQEDCEFEVKLGHIVRPCFKTQGLGM